MSIAVVGRQAWLALLVMFAPLFVDGGEARAADTTTTIQSSANPSVYQSAFTATATVTRNSPATGVPTGNVQFYVDIGFGPFPVGNSGIGPVALNASGTASVSIDFGGPGSISVTAQYLGAGGDSGRQASYTQSFYETTSTEL